MKIKTIIALSLILSNFYGASFATQTISLVKNSSSFAPVSWTLMPNAKNDMIRIHNDSGKYQQVFIQVDANSAAITVVGCHGGADAKNLYPGFSTTCSLASGEFGFLFWYLADDQSLGEAKEAHGTYQIKTNR